METTVAKIKKVLLSQSQSLVETTANEIQNLCLLFHGEDLFFLSCIRDVSKGVKASELDRTDSFFLTPFTAVSDWA